MFKMSYEKYKKRVSKIQGIIVDNKLKQGKIFDYADTYIPAIDSTLSRYTKLSLGMQYYIVEQLQKLPKDDDIIKQSYNMYLVYSKYNI